MGFRSLPIAALVCCVAWSTAHGQIPTPNGVQPRSQEVEIAPVEAVVEPAAETEQPPEPAVVFAAVGVAPAPQPEAAPAGVVLDPTRTAETLTNAVLNAANGWDPTLGRLSTGDAAVDALIVEAGVKHGVDPKLVYAVMNQESTFKRRAVSPKGASGLMQLMPDTARRFGVTDIFDPRQNIDAGTKYLRFLLDLFNNDVELALAAYNAGEYRVIREGYRVPQIRETQNYVKNITARYYGRSKRSFQVTYGRTTVTEEERENIQRLAVSTTDDRGTDGFFNNF